MRHGLLAYDLAWRIVNEVPYLTFHGIYAITPHPSLTAANPQTQEIEGEMSKTTIFQVDRDGYVARLFSLMYELIECSDTTFDLRTSLG
jgi:hypothetical protein